jgi:hypothetical protein
MIIRPFSVSQANPTDAMRQTPFEWTKVRMPMVVGMWKTLEMGLRQGEESDLVKT